MLLALPTPDGLNPSPYANVAAYIIPGNDNGILTSGTVTPRQLQQVPDTSTALSVQDHTHTNYRHLSTLTLLQGKVSLVYSLPSEKYWSRR